MVAAHQVTPSLVDVTQIELHQDTWDSGFTTYYDGMQFVASLPGELTEGNAVSWGASADDGATTTLSDDTTHVRVGTQSLKFTSQSVYESGIRYPAAPTAHWDLSNVDHLTFWAYAVDPSGGGFYDWQPIVILKSADGSLRYDAWDVLMYVGQWALYQIPIAGGDPWLPSSDGSPNLQDINQVEIRQHAMQPGLTIYYDGVGFGMPPPTPAVILNPPSVTAGACPWRVPDLGARAPIRHAH